MSSYQTFTSARVTEPDGPSLIAQLRAADATVGVQHDPGSSTYVLKKATAWAAGEITAAQTVLDAAPAASAQLAAQAWIDQLPIGQKALLLALLDQINTLRTQPSTTFAAVTPAQALAAVRTKAGTL